MSATVVPTRATPVVPPSRRLLTVADLAAMPTSLPSGDVRYELDDGVLVPMPPPGDIHGKRQARIIHHLIVAEDAGLGEARGEVGIILRRNPDRVVGADAAFILTASLPVRRSPEGYLETIPELVVEVRSKNDTNPEIVGKNEEYFRAGVQVVWVIDPAARTVAAHNADGSVQIFRDADALTCGLLPGFTLPVANLFAGG
jgi:Uma2 family endonuclease